MAHEYSQYYYHRHDDVDDDVDDDGDEDEDEEKQMCTHLIIP